jgi:hypothetical protein
MSVFTFYLVCRYAMVHYQHCGSGMRSMIHVGSLDSGQSRVSSPQGSSCHCQASGVVMSSRDPE